MGLITVGFLTGIGFWFTKRWDCVTGGAYNRKLFGLHINGFQCKNPDSLEHTFLECPMNIQFYQDILSWFNTLNNTHINLSVGQIFLQNYPPPAISDDLRRRLDLLILLTKKYIYSTKINEKNVNNLQFIHKIKMQWKIENLT